MKTKLLAALLSFVAPTLAQIAGTVDAFTPWTPGAHIYVATGGITVNGDAFFESGLSTDFRGGIQPQPVRINGAAKIYGAAGTRAYPLRSLWIGNRLDLDGDIYVTEDFTANSIVTLLAGSATIKARSITISGPLRLSRGTSLQLIATGGDVRIDGELFGPLDGTVSLRMNATGRIVAPGKRDASVVVEQGTAVLPGNGRPSNVSTRAYVEPGRELIVGVSVSGGAQLFLIRAVGPTLADFGVSDTLTNPKLSVVASNGRVVATNDDWDGSEATVSAMVNTGAFPLRKGSKDAALRLVLDEGSYTVVVGSADGRSGNALAEVYQVSWP